MHERWLFYSQSEEEDLDATCTGTPVSLIAFYASPPLALEEETQNARILDVLSA